MTFLRQDPQQLVAHSQAHERIERRERLVHIENLGLYHQSARELRTLEHPAGQLVRVAVLEAGQADELRVSIRECAAGGVPVETEHQVLALGEPGKYRALLRN